MFASPSAISSKAAEHRESEGQLLDSATLSGRKMFYAWKRCFDFLLALVSLLLLLPVYFLIAVLIKIDSRGSVLFVNRAVGQYGREFRLYKFRSMHPSNQRDTELADVARNMVHRTPTIFLAGRPVYKTSFAEQGRITRVGRFLRRTSLDELPQLWNILRGDMSFVGPRPSLSVEVSLYSGWQKQRLLVPQGLTGLYQVTARNSVPIDEMVRIDIEYIRTCSFWTDLRILCKTPRAMLSGL